VATAFVVQDSCFTSSTHDLPRVQVTVARIFLILSALAGLAGSALAQDRNSDSKTTTVVMARWGERADSNPYSTYHFAEFFQVRGHWVYPDIGYVDFGHDNYREFFAGGGYTFDPGKHFTAIVELLYGQSMGPAAHSARWLIPWTMLQYRIAPRLGAEASYFAYAPLNSTAVVQHVLERAKLEYKINPHWKIGAGYAGRITEGKSWQNKPFLTTTFITKGGDFEFWFQRLPLNIVQVQLRYKLVYLH